jgi:hypothetical protein
MECIAIGLDEFEFSSSTHCHQHEYQALSSGSRVEEQASKFLDHTRVQGKYTYYGHQRCPRTSCSMYLPLNLLTSCYLEHPEACSFHRTVLSPLILVANRALNSYHPPLHELIFLWRTFRTSEETSLIRTCHDSSLVSMKPQGERHQCL